MHCPCKKKRIVELKCDECGYSSCISHRFHTCDKKIITDKKKIADENPKIIPQKIDKL